MSLFKNLLLSVAILLPLPAYSATYLANFDVTGGVLEGPRDHFLYFDTMSYTFLSPQPIDMIDYFGPAEFVSGPYVDDYVLRLQTNGDGEVAIAQVGSYSDVSGEFLQISGGRVSYYDPGGMLFSGSGSWRVAEVPVPASALTAMFGIFSLFAIRRRAHSV